MEELRYSQMRVSCSTYLGRGTILTVDTDTVLADTHLMKFCCVTLPVVR